MSAPEIYRYNKDEHDQDILTLMGGVNAAVPALVPISYQEFLQLSQEEQENGSWVVTNMPTLMNAYSIGYKNGLSVGQQLDRLSHVGMIIQSTTLDTEAKVIEIYGGTEWTQIEGRFLLGASTNYTVNDTGGEETHTLTVNEIPSHNHTVKSYANGNISGGNTDGYYKASGPNTWATNSTGGGQAHNNMPPYKVVYIWERTA
jgi:hypothetical protein